MIRLPFRLLGLSASLLLAGALVAAARAQSPTDTSVVNPPLPSHATAQDALLATPPPAGTVAPPAVHKRLSPHDVVSNVIKGCRVIIVYGRPHTNDPHTGNVRTVWGGQLVPLFKIWRMGADEATLLITQKPLTIGKGPSSVTVPAGTYSLYVYPETIDRIALVINHQIGQWGLEYHPEQDVGRVLMEKATLQPPVHQFTVAVEKHKGSGGDGDICLMWEDTQYSVPFTVDQREAE